MITRIEREQVVQRIRARDLSLCHRPGVTHDNVGMADEVEKRVAELLVDDAAGDVQ